MYHNAVYDDVIDWIYDNTDAQRMYAREHAKRVSHCDTVNLACMFACVEHNGCIMVLSLSVRRH